ncbi:hypothetical protein B0T16DRAFT_288973, partial [Cercophora newfieldiana]
PSPATLLSDLKTTGYTIIPSLLTPSELTTLRTAAAELTTLTRAGHWPHVRTVGKQFPPWPTPSPQSPLPIWGVQHLLHPNLPIPKPLRDAFTKIYFNDRLLSLCAMLASPASHQDPNTTTPTDDLVMELFNMLVTPSPTQAEPNSNNFSLRWHRDAIPPTASPSEESTLLAHPAYHTQYNLPLYDDDSLLKAGDVVFYDNNILHRGVYEGGKERATLHGSVGHVGGSAARARNVLQHGVGGYVGECEFGCLEGTAREVAEGMRRRLVEMGRDGEVEYLLDG